MAHSSSVRVNGFTNLLPFLVRDVEGIYATYCPGQSSAMRKLMLKLRCRGRLGLERIRGGKNM